MASFVARLVQLQAIDARAYANVAAENRTRTVTLPAVRGQIVDRHGEPLATTLETVRVIADPLTVVDPQGTAEILAPLLGVEAADLAAELSATPRQWVPLADHVPRDVWRQIEELDLRGLHIEPQPDRHYPGGPTGSNVIGFVNSEGHGLGGLELALDGLLAGEDGTRTYERAPGDREIATAGYREDAPVAGQGAQLTIDRDLQWAAQQAIAAKVAESGADSGSVVVMVPSTGEILALAEAPTFDPNDLSAADQDDLRSRALGDIYEPGSTAKVLTLAAAFEEGAITRGEHLEVPGSLERADRTFHDALAHGTWRLTPAGVLAKSSNIGAILVSERIEPATLHSYFAKFGIGQPTGLGFPGESSGILAESDEWWGSQRYTIPFGQGVSVTAVQAASVYATIANDGVRVAPTLVKGHLDEDGALVPAEPAARSQVVSPQTAREVTAMIESVVSEEGTAPNASIAGYRIAGKTGTAQRYDARCGGYCGYTASFIGFGPAESPAVVVACTLQDPVNGHTGGKLCGPVFTEIMTFALQTLKVPPSGSPAPQLDITW